MGEFKLTLDLKILKLLHEEYSLTASEICKKLNYSSGHIYSTINKLNNEKFITTLVNREKHYSLTIKGIKFVRAIPS